MKNLFQKYSFVMIVSIVFFNVFAIVFIVKAIEIHNDIALVIEKQGEILTTVTPKNILPLPSSEVNRIVIQSEIEQSEVVAVNQPEVNQPEDLVELPGDPI